MVPARTGNDAVVRLLRVRLMVVPDAKLPVATVKVTCPAPGSTLVMPNGFTLSRNGADAVVEGVGPIRTAYSPRCAGIHSRRRVPSAPTGPWAFATPSSVRYAIAPAVTPAVVAVTPK